MRYETRAETRSATNGLDGSVVVLADTTTGNRAEVWPALGCNCYRWQVTSEGRPIDLLYSAPNLFDDTRPTRSGIPILFPFPNRIRSGAFSWKGQTYQLPLNDSTQKNAIHGFACRHPWRVIDQGADNTAAWLAAEFHCSRDAPADLKLWPADHRIRMTFRLSDRRLRLSARIDNPDRNPLPFGLGYHPYFRIPLGAGAPMEDCWVQAPGRTYWELVDSLPTGRRLPVDETRELTRLRRVSELAVDDVLHADHEPTEIAPVRLGSLHQSSSGTELRLTASPAFRELVIFTPVHREAFCLEPYTCITDAINLQSNRCDAGLRVIPPGEHWEAEIEAELVSEAEA